MTRLIVYSATFVAFLGGKLNVLHASRNSSLIIPSHCDDLGSNFHTIVDNMDSGYR